VGLPEGGQSGVGLKRCHPLPRPAGAGRPPPPGGGDHRSKCDCPTAGRGKNGEPATATRGADLWLIDRHRLLRADAHDLTAVDRMLEGGRLVFVAFEPALCDRIVHRFRQFTGQDATLAASGQSFATVAAQSKEESLR